MRSRNANSFFSQIPVIDYQQRSAFDIPFTHKTTFNQGMLVPLYVQEVLPADTVKMNKSYVLRMQPSVVPVMDNCWFDTFWFYVPNRLVWDHWQNFMGQNDDTPWVNDTEYTVPTMPRMNGIFDSNDSYPVPIHTLGDYFGLPNCTGDDYGEVAGFPAVSALPFRAYRKIWNDWFRSEVTDTPAPLNTGDKESDASLWFGLLADRYHDYFSSCTPAPQRGESVLIPFASQLPVISGSASHEMGNPIALSSTGDVKYGNLSVLNNGNVLVGDSSGVGEGGSLINVSNLIVDTSTASGTIDELRLALAMQSLFERDARGSRYIEYLKLAFGVTIPDATLQRSQYLGGTHDLVDMSQVIQTSSGTADSPQGNVSGFSKTTGVHFDFEQTFLEHGWLMCLGVVRQQRTYQGGMNRMFTRTSRFDFYDPIFAHLGNQPVYKYELYSPWTVNLPSNPDYGDGTPAPASVFGYQEAWADYKYKPSYVSSMFRSSISSVQDVFPPSDSSYSTFTPSFKIGAGITEYTYADSYGDYPANTSGSTYSLPTLSQNWMQESWLNGHIGDTLAISTTDVGKVINTETFLKLTPTAQQNLLFLFHSGADQFYLDMYFDSNWKRKMPLYSIPGLPKTF